MPVSNGNRLLDRTGTPIRRFAPTKTLGAGGTAIWGGFVQTIEKEPSLIGIQRYQTFSDILLNVDIVAAGVRYFLNLLGKTRWNVSPADDNNPEAVRLAELVEDILHDMDRPWTRVIRRLGMYRFWGFSVMEWTAKRRPDGTIGYLDIAPRPHPTIERWATDDFGKVIAVMQRNPKTLHEVWLPREKVVYIVDESISDDPEGVGLFRHIAPHANRLKTYEKLEGIAFETDLRGIPIARGPIIALQRLVDQGDIEQTKADQMLKVLEDFIQNHYRGPQSGLVLDSAVYTSDDERASPSRNPQWNVELMQGESTALVDIGKAISRKTFSIATILGIGHLLLGEQGRGGSFALSKDRTQGFFLIVDSTLDELAEGLDKDVVDPLFKLNGWDVELKPELVPEPVQFKDVEQITGALEQMARAGAPLDVEDPVINEVRELMGVSARELPTTGVEDAVLRPQDEPVEDEEVMDVGTGGGNQ